MGEQIEGEYKVEGRTKKEIVKLVIRKVQEEYGMKRVENTEGRSLPKMKGLLKYMKKNKLNTCSEWKGNIN